MTALAKYDRLESLGLWRETPQTRGLDVVVGFREATLVLSDPRSEMALSHWSLPAVRRLNPGVVPALYAPDPDGVETLEIDDADMIAALETVRRALIRRRARPGRLRGAILSGTTLLILGLGAVLLPDALIAHTASVLPAISRTQIGRQALTELARLTGPPCETRRGTRAAATLAARLFAPRPASLLVLREGLSAALALPGGMILLPRARVESAPDAETAAGFALVAAEQAATRDPMIALLRHAGVPATFRLLTTGSLPEGALSGYAEELLRAPPPPPLPTDPLLERFRKAGVPATPYAYALDPTGESVLALIEADPFRAGAPPPVLADGDWVSLQAICAD